MKKNKNAVLKHLIFGCVIAGVLFASAGKLRANTEEQIIKRFTVQPGGKLVVVQP